MSKEDRCAGIQICIDEAESMAKSFREYAEKAAPKGNEEVQEWQKRGILQILYDNSATEFQCFAEKLKCLKRAEALKDA